MIDLIQQHIDNNICSVRIRYDSVQKKYRAHDGVMQRSNDEGILIFVNPIDKKPFFLARIGANVHGGLKQQALRYLSPKSSYWKNYGALFSSITEKTPTLECYLFRDSDSIIDELEIRNFNQTRLSST